MSALPPKADMCGATRDVRFGPKADIAPLLDYFVGAPDEGIGDVDIKCLCGFEIQDHLHFRGLIDRQISRFFTFKYPTAVDADLSIQFGVIGSVTQQSTGCGKFAIRKDRGHSMASCKFTQSLAATGKKCVSPDHEPAQS